MSDKRELAAGWENPPAVRQSGNPSGRSGAAKFAKRRLQQLIPEALGKGKNGLRYAEPKTALESMVNRLVSDAALGKVMSARLVLSLLDAEIAEIEEPAPE